MKFLFSVATQSPAAASAASRSWVTLSYSKQSLAADQSLSQVPLPSITKAMNFSSMSLGFYNDPCEIPGRFLFMKSVCFLFLGGGVLMPEKGSEV